MFSKYPSICFVVLLISRWIKKRKLFFFCSNIIDYNYVHRLDSILNSNQLQEKKNSDENFY